MHVVLNDRLPEPPEGFRWWIHTYEGSGGEQWLKVKLQKPILQTTWYGGKKPLYKTVAHKTVIPSIGSGFIIDRIVKEAKGCLSHWESRGELDQYTGYYYGKNHNVS